MCIFFLFCALILFFSLRCTVWRVELLHLSWSKSSVCSSFRRLSLPFCLRCVFSFLFRWFIAGQEMKALYCIIPCWKVCVCARVCVSERWWWCWSRIVWRAKMRERQHCSCSRCCSWVAPAVKDRQKRDLYFWWDIHWFISSVLLQLLDHGTFGFVLFYFIFFTCCVCVLKCLTSGLCFI